MPWFRKMLGGVAFVGKHIYVDLGSSMEMSLFDSIDYAKALMIVSIGLIVAAFGYQLISFLQHDPRKRQQLTRNEIQGSSQISKETLGFDRTRCFYLTATAAFLVTVLIASRGSAVLSGLRDGLFVGSHEAIIQARFAVLSNNYVTYVMACNILPFFAVATWIAESRSSELNRRIWARCIVFITTLYQLCIFQKRPAIVFLCMIIAATFLVSTSRASVKRKGKTWLSLCLPGAAAMSLLMFLYYISTSVRDVAENWLEAMNALFLISLTRIVGRLSVPAVWYAHYFPKIDDHYGISNVGLIAKVFGYETYLDTREVYYYVTGDPNGSGAICAIVDFYGGFGWLGCIAGSFLIGGLLAFIDAKIRDTNIKSVNVLFTVTACVFAYYLSQSSIFRASLGYGGLFFIICWILLGARFRNESQQSIHSGADTLIPKDVCHSRNIS